MKPAPNIPILYEDNHIIVVVKPFNMPSQSDETGDRDLLTAIKDDIKIRHNKPGNVYVGLVHRLDRPSGGTMVFAKTSKAASRLSDAIRTRSIDKTYVAVVHGRPEPAAATLVHHLWKDNAKQKVFAVRANHKQAKEAILHYEVAGTRDSLSLVRIRLETGRTHQIRAQFATVGHPLYGDQKYGASVNTPGQQLALWSSELAFAHPVTKERLAFRSAPPQVFPWSNWEELFR